MANRREGPSRRLSDVEFQVRRDKGLCFHCDEQYSGHKCTARDQKELRVLLIMENDEEWEVLDGEEEMTETFKLKQVNVEPVAELSLNSMVGLSNPGTVKLRGSINQQTVIVTVDSGATHNFISQKLEELHIVVVEIKNNGVIMGLGAAVKGKGVCDGVNLKVGELMIVDGGVNVILGMQWLYTLGVTEVDWRNLSMVINQKGKKIMLKGDPSLTKARVSLKRMVKMWATEDQGYLIKCRALEGGVSMTEWYGVG